MSLHKKLWYALINIIALVHLISLSFTLAKNNALQNYIIHVNKQPDDAPHINPIHYHKSFLPSTIAHRFLHSYKHVISGFSARLTAAEVESLTEKEGFISAHPERIYKLSTTRSPVFLGLRTGSGLWNTSNQGKGAIIGILDTGVLPNHPSFSDVDMPSKPPLSWKGRCEFPNATCNNKLIGARSFGSSENPNDELGHGTHTASTAAGTFVPNACLLGSACGTASGIAPKAHLAVYKVCSPDCPDGNIIAGIDAAIEDGVDILSMSIGENPAPFHSNHVAIALFAAVQKGIFVSCSAGNEGPTPSTVQNVAPWILTVGASTIDRSLRAIAKLGDGREFIGETVFQPKNFTSTLLPLVYGGVCIDLSKIDVHGKLVLCDGSSEIYPLDQSQTVKDANGAGAILPNQKLYGFSTYAEAHCLPATEVSYLAGEKIKAYINSTKSPTATILLKGTIIGDPLAPIVAAFSSRGPSPVSPGILKPDVIGPGVNILAAWPYHFDDDVDSKLTFAVTSGTSVSTPHLSGVAALLKVAHPDWSPASIKSAIMTTADTVNVGRRPILDERLAPADVFATGAGHANPMRANDPGLVYDMKTDDYVPYLCGLGYTDQQVERIVRKSVNCSAVKSIPEGQLNYPTFSVSLGSTDSREVTFTRTVTNVGGAFSYYYVKIFAPEGVNVTVKPRSLWFRRVNETATYSVTFSRRINSSNINEYAQGYLQWLSEKHSVKSVISVKFTSDLSIDV